MADTPQKKIVTITEWAEMYGVSVLMDLAQTHPYCQNWTIKHSSTGPSVCMHSSKTILLEPVEGRPMHYVLELLFHEIAHVLRGLTNGDSPHDGNFYMFYAELLLIYVVGQKRIKAYRKVVGEEVGSKEGDLFAGPWGGPPN